MRWSKGCDCTPNSGWKNYLREFVESVAIIVNSVYEEYLSNYSIDKWQLRNNYIDVILGRVPESDFIRKHIDLNEDLNLEKIISNLLQSQYERQRMFTSCGWFFDDFDRIEPHNIIAYASQSLNLISELNGIDYFEVLKPLLEKIVSTKTGITGVDVFNKFYIRPR
jgi:hypothetical protein